MQAEGKCFSSLLLRVPMTVSVWCRQSRPVISPMRMGRWFRPKYSTPPMFPVQPARSPSWMPPELKGGLPHQLLGVPPHFPLPRLPRSLSLVWVAGVNDNCIASAPATNRRKRSVVGNPSVTVVLDCTGNGGMVPSERDDMFQLRKQPTKTTVGPLDRLEFVGWIRKLS